MAAAGRLSQQAARALRIAAQGFPPPRRRSIPRLLSDHGWVRTLGGSEAYVALLARSPGLTRARLDAALLGGEARVSPAARGCIYLIPGADRALALQLARGLTRSRDARDAAKAGIRPGELDKLGRAVVQILRDQGPQSTDELRRNLPQNAVRSLGEAGKKVGVSSPLPPALRQLEFAGRIERLPIEGRIDSERYLWRPTDAALPELPAAELHRELAARYFAAAGVAALADFAAWAGLGKRDAAAAVDGLDLREVDVVGEPGPQLAGGRRSDGAQQACALLPFEDNLTALHGGMAKFIATEFHGLKVPIWGRGRGTTLGDAAHAAMRPVLAEGRIRGMWEYDPDRRCVQLGLFEPVARRTRGMLSEHAEALTALLRDELGHGHSYSLDSDDELRKRLAVVTRLRG